MSIVEDIYNLLKELKGLSDKYKDEKMSGKLFEIQNKFYELKEENELLKTRIFELENVKELEQDLELLSNGLYIRKSEKEQGKNIYYCSSCFNNHKKLYPIVTGSLRTNHFCSNCKMSVGFR
ncbi:MAG: hypothetical protein IJA32_01890 [Lachnospiraceae bacterium]|nr:hypothetical protein [Lachnospiraceae bacterium]